MATTYSLKSSSYDGRVLTLSCTQTPNPANNTSTIKWTLTVSGGNSNYYSTGPTTVTINGTQVYYSARVSYTAQKFPAAKGSTSGTLTVTHNSNGSKSVAVSLATAIYNTAVSTSSGTWTLDTIGRTSTASINSALIGDWATCTISSANTSYRHKVYFTCLGQTTTVGDNLAGGSHSFMIPTSYYDVFGSRVSASATGTCETYSGGSLIGSTSFTFTINGPGGADSAPEVEFEAYDNNSDTLELTGDASTIILGYSTISYNVNATGKNGATIASYRVTNGSTSKTTASGRFNNPTSGTVVATVTDSRGNKTQKTVILDTITYTPLTCNIVNTTLSSAGTMSISVSGNYFSGSFGNLMNDLDVYYRYKQSGGSYSSWYSMSATTSGNTYTATASRTGLNPEAQYVFQARAVDRLSDVNSDGSNVQNKPVFDWSGTDFNFNVPVHFAAGATGLESSGGGGISNGTIDGDLKITGNLSLKGSSNYGNSIKFGDGSYTYIAEEADDELTIHADEIILDGDVTITSTGTNTEAGAVMAGLWTPRLSPALNYTYEVQEGWYHIVGKTATIGFFLTATVPSGYHTTKVEILGFPFELDYRAAGGGVAYNVYGAAGFCFGCWMIDENGIITPRLVPCNNTSAGNLSITTNCCYPSGGGQMTLSGTICAHVIVE